MYDTDLVIDGGRTTDADAAAAACAASSLSSSVGITHTHGGADGGRYRSSRRRPASDAAVSVDNVQLERIVDVAAQLQQQHSNSQLPAGHGRS